MLHTPVLPELAWRGPLGKQLAEDPAAGREGARRRLPDRLAAHGRGARRLAVPGQRPRPAAPARAPTRTRTRPCSSSRPTGDAFLSRAALRRTGAVGAAAGAPHAPGQALGAAHPARPTGRLDQRVRDRQRGAASRRGRPTATGPYADRFGGQLVLVTGAASGIGRATAFAFAEAGARVVAVDRDAEGAARTAEMSRLIGAPEAWAETVDVSDEQAMEKLAEKVATEYGVVDVLVNNAGIGLSGLLPRHQRRRTGRRSSTSICGASSTAAGSSAGRWPSAARAAISSTPRRPPRTSPPRRCPPTAPPRRRC